MRGDFIIQIINLLELIASFLIEEVGKWYPGHKSLNKEISEIVRIGDGRFCYPNESFSPELDSEKE